MNIKEETKEKIKEAVKRYAIPKADEENWLTAVEKLDNDSLMNIVSFLNERPQQFPWLNTVFQRKIDVMEEKDEEAWEKIIEEEKKVLDNFT